MTRFLILLIALGLSGCGETAEPESQPQPPKAQAAQVFSAQVDGLNKAKQTDAEAKQAIELQKRIIEESGQ